MISEAGREALRESNRRRATHRMTGTPTMQAWSDMLQRCYNPNSPRFKDYGGRGIFVRDPWLTFDVFFSDMGVKPAGLSLGRIDNDGPYCKENCAWQTRKEQQRNRRDNRILVWKGVRLTATEWAERLNIGISAFRNRLRKNWRIEKIMTYEYRPRKQSNRS